MPVSRRSFIASAGITAVVPAWLAPPAARSRDPGAPHPSAARAAMAATPTTAATPQYLFFTPAEARFVAAACERFIPTDASGGGALAAGVPFYMDTHFGGDWGAGRAAYRRGAWQAGTPHRACTVSVAASVTTPAAPAAAFRTAVGVIDASWAARGTAFDRLGAADQDAFLRALESGVDLGGVASAGFFEMLLGMTVEGFFSHPDLGRHRARVAWRMRGFPGAVSSCA